MSEISSITPSPEALEQATALVRAGNFTGAEEFLANVLSRAPQSLAIRNLYARVLLLQRKNQEAAVVAQATLEAHPNDWRAMAQLAQILLRIGRTQEADELLLRTTKDFPDRPQLSVLHAEAKLLCGDIASAASLMEKQDAAGSDSGRATALKIVILDATGDHAAAQALLRAGSEPPGELTTLYRATIRAFMRLHRDDTALALARNACASLPEATSLRVMCAERLLKAGEARQALDVLEQAPVREDLPEDEAVRLERMKGETLRALRDREGAIAVYKNILAKRPDDEDALRLLYVLHQQAGQSQELNTYAKRLSALSAKKMPPTLAAGLESLHAQIPKTPVKSERVDWAWELADKNVWSKDAWLRALQWGQNAEALLRSWWLSHPDRAAEIDALIERPQNDALDKLLIDARCLCVTTHMGPLAASVRFLQTCGRPFRGFGFPGLDPAVGDGPTLRIAAGRPSSMRELVQEIGKGTLIGFAAESPQETQSLAFDFLGRRITLATLVPRLIYSQHATSIWSQALWRDGRIVVEVARFPDPNEGEDLEAWCRRWLESYLSRVETVMRGTPENLVLGHGIWRNLR